MDALEYKASIDPDFAKYWNAMNNYEPTYATDEKDDDLKNEFNMTDLANETVKSVVEGGTWGDLFKSEIEGLNLLGSWEKANRTIIKRVFMDFPEWLTSTYITAPKDFYKPKFITH